MSCVNVGSLVAEGDWARGLTLTALRRAMDATRRTLFLRMGDGI
jgi:hypothetical protein